MTDEPDFKTGSDSNNTTSTNNCDSDNSTTIKRSNHLSNNNDDQLSAPVDVKDLPQNGLKSALATLNENHAPAVAKDTPESCMETSVSSWQQEHNATTITASANAGCHSPTTRTPSPNKRVNNGLAHHLRPQSATLTIASSNDMAAVVSVASPNAHLSVGTAASNAGGTSGSSSKEDIGVIDYTLNAAAAAASSTTATATTMATTTSASLATTLLAKGNSKLTTNNCSNDIGRYPIASAATSTFGGRLQFFKDGKFILELARSKDGEKGGWVSVPRKLFRTPAATSSTVTPTSLTSSAYPKNESSTSLSFSDDNSSIQSSPWQREHCWKQSTPRHGISKEMSFYYRRYGGVPRSRQDYRLAARKRRLPYDATYALADMADVALQRSAQLAEQSADTEATRTAGDVDMPKLNAPNVQDKPVPTKCVESDDAKALQPEKDAALRAVLAESTDTSVPSAAIDGNKASGDSGEVPSAAVVVAQAEKETDVVQKMNTSESDVADGCDEINVVGDVDNTVLADKAQTPMQLNGNVEDGQTRPDSCATNGGEGEEKRLKNGKNIRAKLSTIIRQLNDRMHLRLVSLSSTKTSAVQSGSVAPLGSGVFANAASNQQHHHNHAYKVTPQTSSAAAVSTRLVEYHQQHVSPRKRILRELEKVSLEDTAVIALAQSGAAGGKRSRAKGVASITTTGALTTPYKNNKAPMQRRVATTAAETPTLNGNHLAATALVKAKSSLAPTTATTVVPTRLYSSYSIHSLLSGGSSNNNNSMPSCSTVAKKPVDTVIVSSSYQSAAQCADLRTMLSSPKSPESCGGKSPSMHAAASKKRSPPYPASTYMHEGRSRSPTASGLMEYTNAQRSPHATPPDYKLRYPHIVERSGATSPTAAASSSHQQHYLQKHQQGFYSPYMMSPKYVPTPSAVSSPNSPRHMSAFSATSAGASVSAPVHIPNCSPTASSAAQRDFSPPRSMTASPRASSANARTVLKRSTSIRRQYAAPLNSASGSIVSPSPVEPNHHQRHEEANITTPPPPQPPQPPQERKMSSMFGNSGAHLLQQQQPRASPIGGMLPSHYYMYPPPPPPVQSGSSSTQAAAAAAAAAAAYIPPVAMPTYYHQYLSTLAALRHNPMWLHHYPLTPHHPAVMATAAGTPTSVSASASRLSPPYAGFPAYNQHILAAAAASASSVGLLGVGGLGGGGGGGGGSLTAAQSPKATDSNDLNLAAAKDNHLQHQALYRHVQYQQHHQTHLAGGSGVAKVLSLPPANPGCSASTHSLFPISIKDEHSSDVPLNLSKH